MFGNNMMVQLGATVNLVDAERVLQNFTRQPYTVTTRIRVDGQEAIREISTWIDDVGRRMQRITDTNAMGENIRDTVRPIKELTSAYEPLIKNVTKYTNAQGNTVKTIRETNKYGEQIVTTFTKIRQANGSLVSETTRYNETLNKLESSSREVVTDEQQLAREAERVAQAERRAQEQTRRLAEEQAKANRETKSLGQSFSDMIVKLSKYYLASMPIRAVTKALSESVQIVKQFDDALTEFKKVSDLSGESLRNYTKQLGELGAVIGKTKTEMVEASTSFRKSGFTDEDSAKLGQVAL